MNKRFTIPPISGPHVGETFTGHYYHYIKNQKFRTIGISDKPILYVGPMSGMILSEIFNSIYFLPFLFILLRFFLNSLFEILISETYVFKIFGDYYTLFISNRNFKLNLAGFGLVGWSPFA